MSDEEAIRRGERAAAILNDPLVVEAFGAIEAEYIRRWRAPDGPPEEREKLWLALQNLELFRAAFQTYIRSGQVAIHRAQEKRARKGKTEP